MIAGIVIVLVLVPIWAREVAACGVVSCCVASWATQENGEMEEKQLPVAAVKKRRVSTKGALGKAERTKNRWNKVFDTLLKSGAKRSVDEIRLLLMGERGDWGMERKNSCERFVKHKEKWNAEAKVLQARIEGLQEALEFMIERHGMPNKSDGKNLK